MLKKLMKSIRRNLLKINWIRREVEAYRMERELEEYSKRWAEIMHAGQAVRETRITEDRVAIPRCMDSVTWGGTKL